MIDLPTCIRKLRKFIDYSQEDLAHELGMTQSAYSKLENGKTRLDVDRLQQLADFYGLSPADLISKDSAELWMLLGANPKFRDIWKG